MNRPLRSGFLAAVMGAAFLSCVGCISQSAQIAGTPTPSSSPTPLPEIYSPVITTTPIPTDDMGKRLTEEDHYYKYLSFSEISVYEFESGTHLDGICTNEYSKPLKGALNVVYYNKQGKPCGSGKIRTADGGLTLLPGTNRIYADILTDTTVTGMNFTLEVTETFEPIEN